MQQAMPMQWQRQTHLLATLVRLRQWLRLRLLISTTQPFKHCWHNWEQNQFSKTSWGACPFYPKRSAL
jgi:hypothetical protein